MRSVVVAVVFLGLSAVAARADDPVQRVQSPLPAMAANPDWTGFYLGGRGGLNFHSTTYDFANTTPGVYDHHTRIGEAGNRAAYGFYLGYNYQLPGPFVVGVEGDVTSFVGRFQLAGPTRDFLQKLHRVDTIAGRLGFLITPTTLAYGKAGASRIRLSGFDDTLPAVPFTKTVNGTTYGVGIESMVTENVLVRVEAERTQANSDLVLTQNADKYRPEVLQVMGGVALKFNPGPPGSTTRIAWLPWPSAITRSWTSVYVGADIGKGGGRVATNGLASGGSIGPFTDTAQLHSFFAGGDIQLPAFLQVGPTLVVGAQYSKSWANLVFDEPTGNPINGGTATIFRIANISNIRAITGRMGVLVTPSTLVYGRGGPARINFTATPAYFNAVNPASGAGTFDMLATQAGGGFETFITDHVALRIEGLFTQAAHNVVLNGVAPADTRLKPSVATGTVGLLAKF